MEKWQAAQFYQQIEHLLKTEKLNKQEKKILADALVLMKRQEPVNQIAGQLYQRLNWQKSLGERGEEPKMNAKVAELLEKVKPYEKFARVVPGVEGARSTWGMMWQGESLGEDEGVFPAFPGVAYKFDPSEKEKSLATATAKVGDEEIMADAGTLGHSAKFWAGIFLAVLVGLIALAIVLNWIMGASSQ